MGALAGLQAALPQLRLAVRQGDVLLAIGVLAILVVLSCRCPPSCSTCASRSRSRSRS